MYTYLPLPNYDYATHTQTQYIHLMRLNMSIYHHDTFEKHLIQFGWHRALILIQNAKIKPSFLLPSATN